MGAETPVRDAGAAAGEDSPPAARPPPPGAGPPPPGAHALKSQPGGQTPHHDLVNEGALPCIRVGTVGSRRKRILLLRSGLDEYVRRLRMVEWEKDARPTATVDPDAVRGRVLAGRGGRGQVTA